MPSRYAVKNSILSLLDQTFLSERTIAAPAVYGIALSTVCNLKCPHCLRESLGIRENAFMPIDELKRCGEALKSARKISLFGLGEPFLHPQFFECISYLKSLGLEIATQSHGMSLKPEVREKIIETQIDDLTISMDGADKKIFEETRVNAVYETVIENVTALAALKKERGARLPEININMTVMRKNIRQTSDLVRLAHRMGAQSVSFSSVVIYKEADIPNSVVDEPIFEECMEKARRVAKDVGLGFTFWRQKPIWWEGDFFNPNSAYGCGQLWTTQIFEPDGSVKLCCYIEKDIDNVFKSDPISAYNGEELRRQRRLLLEGQVRPECQGCMYLRERSPAWVQAMINEATKMTMSETLLTDDDRRELLAVIADFQARKDALFPSHSHARPNADSNVSGQKSAFAVWEG